MIIRTVRVRNFRCIKDETLHCERLTILVGANGSGKSTFLKALDLFYTPSAKYSEEDFYNRDTSELIVITVTFTDLTEQERQLFASYMEGETLTVEKELAWPPGRGSQKYFGLTLQCPDFQHVRAANKVAEKRAAYQALVDLGKFPGLPNLPGNASAERIERALQDWENAHRETLQRVRDGGQFFGFKEVGQAHLERYTRFLYIPAVRDASEDATEGKGSVLSELMDLVVRSTLAQRDDIRKLLEETQKRYREIMTELTELQTLAGRMTETLNTFAPGAQIQLNWLSDETVEIPMPKADVKVVEDGYPSAVERTGHGVQRAFILTALQHLALAQAPKENEAIQQHPSDAPMSSVPLEGNASTPTLPNLILGIEEPELYQHPSRQRHLARVLLQLAKGGIKGVAQSAQVIYTTHSPLLVDLQRFHQIRLLRKEEVEDGKPKQTKIFQATMEQVTRVIEKADGVAEGTYLAEGVYARLQTLMTPWTNEGFFANVVVLVEGEDDRAAILGMAKAMGHEFESMDIAVIPCMGKTNLHKAAAIFMTLKIPTYVVWDSDEGKNTKKNTKEDNHRLLRLFGAPLEDYPGKVTENFACFKRDMDTTLREELTPDTYDSLLEECKSDFGYDDNNHARKNPLVVKCIIEKASQRGKDCITLKQIVTAVLKLRYSSS